MQVVCKNCGKIFNLSQNDETKIEELSTPNTYPVKLNSFLCKNCFNKDTWDFNGGKEWTQEIEDELKGIMRNGFTIYHKRLVNSVATWDIDQVKENWEVSMLPYLS